MGKSPKRRISPKGRKPRTSKSRLQKSSRRSPKGRKPRTSKSRLQKSNRRSQKGGGGCDGEWKTEDYNMESSQDIVRLHRAVNCRITYLATKPWNRMAKSGEGESNQKRTLMISMLDFLQDTEMAVGQMIGKKEEELVVLEKRQQAKAEADNFGVVIAGSTAITAADKVFIAKAKVMKRGDRIRLLGGEWVVDTTRGEDATKGGTVAAPVAPGMGRTLALAKLKKLERRAWVGASDESKAGAKAANRGWANSVTESEELAEAAVVKRNEFLAHARAKVNEENKSVRDNFDSIQYLPDWGAITSASSNIGPRALYSVVAARVDRTRAILQRIFGLNPDVSRNHEIKLLRYLEALEKLDRGADNSGVFHEINTPWGIPMAVGFNTRNM